MKIKRVQFNHYGAASEMYIGEYDLPQPKQNEVLVRVKAAAINPLDWRQRQGEMKLFMDRKFPKGIGNDFAGVVESVGENVRHVKAGDEVFGTMPIRNPGAFADALVTQARFVAKKPSEISFAEAACLPIPAATAWAAILTKAKVSAHSRVLITGCTGSVGAMATQLSIATGAKVAGTCSQTSMNNAQLAGVSPVFDYNDKISLSNTEPFDVIFDTAGKLDIKRGLSLLKPKGVFIDINPNAGRILRGLLSRRYKLVFATMGMKYLPNIANFASQGTLKPAIGLKTSFLDAIETIKAIEGGQRVQGKTVLLFQE